MSIGYPESKIKTVERIILATDPSYSPPKDIFEEIIKDADIIILAVKPWLVEIVSEELENKIDYKKQIVVSIAAGVSITDIQSSTLYQ